MLEINISTILLQMANFFILVFILYRFLFKPLQNVLQRRENATLQAMGAAQQAKQDAEALRKRYEEKSNNIDSEIAARRNEARMVIDQTRQQMLREVQTEVDQLKAQTEETLSKLQSEAIQNHKQKLGNLASEFTRGILMDVMTPEIQTTFQNEFLNRLREIDLSTYLSDIPQGEKVFAQVVMAVLPDQAYQTQLNSVLQRDPTREVHLTYEVDPGLIAGGVVRFENELIDGSLQGQINHLQKRYQEIA